jgi:hypothetical protein
MAPLAKAAASYYANIHCSYSVIGPQLASREVGLEINVEKNNCMLLSLHQNAGQNRDIKIAKKYFANTSPPMWSSGQSSWLQIQGPGFDSRRYQIF